MYVCRRCSVYIRGVFYLPLLFPILQDLVIPHLTRPHLFLPLDLETSVKKKKEKEKEKKKHSFYER